MMVAKSPRLAWVGRSVSIAWVYVFLVAASIVLSAITSAERITFSIGGVDLNGRVATYFVVAAVSCLFAIPIVIRMERRPIWLKLMLATVAWFSFTAIVAHHSPVEWLPTVVRFALYFSAATISFWFARSLCGRDQVREVSRLLPLAVLAAAAIPAVAGTAEFVRGTAPVINGAPRVSGSMPTHPVAFSLVLVLGALVIMGPAILRGRSWGGVLCWIAVAALTMLVFTTFTRLAIILLVASGAAVAALLPATRRVRVTRVAGAFVLGASAILLALPSFEARFTYPTPISQVISPSTNEGPQTQTGADSALDFDVDGSIAYRIMLTRYGLEYLSQSPLVGQGPGSFHRLFQADSGRARVAAHNDLLSVAVETGIPGLLLYLFTLASVAWALWPRRSTGIREADALIVTALVALGAINLGAAIHNPLYFVEIELPIWIFVGTALGLRGWARTTAEQPSGDTMKP